MSTQCIALQPTANSLSDGRYVRLRSCHFRNWVQGALRGRRRLAKLSPLGRAHWPSRPQISSPIGWLAINYPGMAAIWKYLQLIIPVWRRLGNTCIMSALSQHWHVWGHRDNVGVHCQDTYYYSHRRILPSGKVKTCSITTNVWDRLWSWITKFFQLITI